MLTSCYLYKPANLQLNATDNAYVTSTTPDADDNYFIDSTSGFNTAYDFRNCTLYESFGIGLVRTSDEFGSDVQSKGDSVLTEVFNEINSAYKTATNNKFYFRLEWYDDNADLKDYV